MMTEEEAKTKWCPFARQLDFAFSGDDKLGAYGGTANRDYLGNPLSECLCIGSKCMAWRWEVTFYEIGGREQSDTNGYCGLAGVQR